MSTLSIPVFVNATYYLISGNASLIGPLSASIYRQSRTLTTLTPAVISRTPLSGYALSYSTSLTSDVTLSPVPSSLGGSLDGVGYTGALSTEVEGTFYAQYYSTYHIDGQPPGVNFQTYSYLTGVAIDAIDGSLTRDTVTVTAGGVIDEGVGVADLYTGASLTGTKLLLQIPGTGEVREFATIAGGPSNARSAVATISASEAKDLPKSSEPIKMRFKKENGFLSPWVPLRFAPWADAVPSDTENGFEVDTSASYDLDDGIVARRFYLKNGLTSIDITELATPDPDHPETFAFDWEELASFAGYDFAPEVPVQFDFTVEDAGGLTDTATFSVTPPATLGVQQIGRVQLRDGRLLYAVVESGAVKTRRGELDGNTLTLEVVDTTEDCSAPSLGVRRDGTVVRSIRGTSGQVLFQASADGGKTWH